MVANLDEFVEFPDPFVDPDGYNASVEKLKTIIGDCTQREKIIPLLVVINLVITPPMPGITPTV